MREEGDTGAVEFLFSIYWRGRFCTGKTKDESGFGVDAPDLAGEKGVLDQEADADVVWVFQGGVEEGVFAGFC